MRIVKLKKPLGNMLNIQEGWLHKDVKRKKALNNILHDITDLPYNEAKKILDIARTVIDEAERAERSIESYAELSLVCPHCGMPLSVRVKSFDLPPYQCSYCKGYIDYLSFLK